MLVERVLLCSLQIIALCLNCSIVTKSALVSLLAIYNCVCLFRIELLFIILKVLDVGCSEAKLVTNLKIHCPRVEEIVGIDIDNEALSLNNYRVKPLMAEYLFKRSTKLRMALYQGISLYLYLI